MFLIDFSNVFVDSYNVFVDFSNVFVDLFNVFMKKESWKEGYTLFKQKDLYKIPQALVEEIMTVVNSVYFR